MRRIRPFFFIQIAVIPMKLLLRCVLSVQTTFIVDRAGKKCRLKKEEAGCLKNKKRKKRMIQRNKSIAAADNHMPNYTITSSSDSLQFQSLHKRRRERKKRIFLILFVLFFFFWDEVRMHIMNRYFHVTKAST